MQGWGGSCRGRVGWVIQGWGGPCRDGTGWVIAGWELQGTESKIATGYQI